MGCNLPKLQLHSMGIDKLVPSVESASVYLRTLARNATGQPVTTYSSFYRGPQAGGEMHVIIVDNGRTEMLKDKILAESLKCIRCGGCLNTCPVYRRSGGYSYNYTIPGPIGIAVGASTMTPTPSPGLVPCAALAPMCAPPRCHWTRSSSVSVASRPSRVNCHMAKAVICLWSVSLWPAPLC